MARLARFSLLFSSLLALATTRCGAGDDLSGADDEWGMDGPMSPVPPRGKEDSEYRRGLLVKTDTSRTQVWTARNDWEDRDTAAARKAGLAWGQGSGLNWDEKYARWLESLRWIPSVGGTWQTVELTTPWGKTLPSPQLECAEMSLMLRITFSAWYELPFFLEAQDESGQRVYFGHNGVRTATGRYAQSPEFAVAYRDTSASPPQDPVTGWPHDAKLRTRKLWGGEDEQPMVAPGAPLGAYLDEIHLNKRAGYFTVMALNYLGSVNLADTANTYNIVPEAVRPGDTLVERWQRVGIGHTLVVKEVVALGEGNLDVVTVSGSMPRRQAKRESGLSSKGYFTSDAAGGPGTNFEGDEYAKLGGGLKRWRVTKNVDGYWTNTWMDADEAHWIDSTDLARISARPARFEDLLGQVSPEQQRTELLAQIEDSRRHLSQYPASCSARERRERAFEDLYDLGSRELDLTREQIDAEHRTLADSVLAELVYGRSKTCCWNSTTALMYQIVMDYAAAEQEEAGDACVAPTVFMSHGDGYRRWAELAERTGRASSWRTWSEDEACAQRDEPADTEAEHRGTPHCELGTGSGGGEGCTDPLEPNESRTDARAISGTVEGLRICAGDVDWLGVEAAATVRIEFTHSSGDLDMIAVDATGADVGDSAGTSDSEQVSVPAGGAVKVFGFGGAQTAYRVVVN